MPTPPEHTKWKPGQSGNPSGRPKSFAKRIRDETAGGAELVEYALEQFRSGDKRTRWEALKWLTEYGWGKAPSHAPIEDGDPLELGDVERRVADLVDELAARREAKTPRPVEARTVADAGKNGAGSA